MNYKIEIIDGQTEDFLIYAKRESGVLKKIEELLCKAEKTVFGYSDRTVCKLDTENTYCFFSEGGRVYALASEGRFEVKERLYRLEETFSSDFIKINQSCLVNSSKIKRFEASIGGSLLVILKNGYKDYVSRRQLKSVKERIGF